MKRVSKLILTVTLLILFQSNAYTQWDTLGNVVYADTADLWGFKTALSADGKVFVTGAPLNNELGRYQGKSAVFELAGNQWVQKGAFFFGLKPQDRNGLGVDINYNGSRVAIANATDPSYGEGSVIVYEWVNNNWNQIGDTLFAPNSYADAFGSSVSLNYIGNTIIVGAPFYDSLAFNNGGAFVFDWNGMGWIKRGRALVGDASDDKFGISTDIDSLGNQVVIGTPNHDINGNRSGIAKVFQWIGNSWVQKGNSLYGDSTLNDFGASVSMSADGNIIAVGAPNYSKVTNYRGMVRVFQWQNNAWSQMGQDILGDTTIEEEGYSIGLSHDGKTLVTGAKGAYRTSSNSDGRVKVFKWNGNSWQQKGANLNGRGGSRGFSCAIDKTGNIVAAGAPILTTPTNGTGEVVIYTCNKEVYDTTITCATYYSPSGKVIIQNPGLYNFSDTVLGNLSCDSVINVNLTLINIDTSVTIFNDSISANLSGQSYQWLDCANNYSAISGETSRGFKPTSDGNYAVEIDNGNCKDTSTCVQILGVGIEDINRNKHFLVSPNPFEGHITVKLKKKYPELSARIFDISGKLVKEIKVNQTDVFDIHMTNEQGIYFLKLNSKDQMLGVVKLVKE